MRVSKTGLLWLLIFSIAFWGLSTLETFAARTELLGTLVGQCDYDPYGRLIRETGPNAATCPFRYSTKYRDPDLDLYYYGHRWYDAAAMKWLTPDPIGERGGVNLTAFGDGDPINQVDPLGLEPWTRRGHHIVPISEVEEIQRVTGPWSEDLLRALDSKRIPTLVTHGWDVAHRQYNLRVRSILETYLSKTQADPTKLSGTAAHKWVAGLIRRIEQSDDPFIQGYLQMVRSGKSTKEIAEWAARYRDEIFAGVRQGRGAFWLERVADDIGEHTGRSLLRLSLRRGKTVLKAVGPAIVVYFVATSADAGEAIQTVLPPGVDYAWEYTRRFYERAFEGARAIGLGEPTPAQLGSGIPLIRGSAQRGVLLRELLEGR